MTSGLFIVSSWLVECVVRNWALLSILSTIGLLVLIPYVVLRRYVKLIINIFDDTPPPLAMELRDYERLDGERVAFRAFDGHALRGMLLRGSADRPWRGMILFAHEHGSDAYSCARYCRPLLAAGYDVMTFDFRGHGQSRSEEGYQPRQWVSDREQADMLGAIAYAEDHLERQGRPRELGLVGISRGAGAAILASVGVESVRAILTDGAFSSDTTLEYLMQRWVSIFAKVRLIYENHPPAFWRFLRWLTFRECRRRFNCRYPSVRKAILRLGHTPIFFVHGERDSYIPVAQSQMLYELAKGPKYLWIVPGAKHNQCVMQQPEEYADRTVRFFNQHLSRCDDEAEPLSRRSLSELVQPLADPLELERSQRSRPAGRSATP